MSARFNLFTMVLGIVAAPVLAFAQTQTDIVPQVENSNFTFSAITNATVYVRSGPGEAYYATMKLSKGSPLTVVGHKFEWLKVLPPEGSFSYISKQFVEKQGDSATGKVTRDTVNIRAGSKLSQLKSLVQCQLNTGDSVTIVGEQDEYYLIQPPSEAYLFVYQKLADPVKMIGATTRPTGGFVVVDGIGTARRADPTAGDPPTTQPSGLAVTPDIDRAKAETEFDRLEAAYRESATKPIDQQPLPDLLAGYEKLAANQHLPTSMLRIVELRLPALKAKNEVRESILAAERRQAALRAKAEIAQHDREQQEAKIKGAFQVFVALGTVQASSFQPGGGTLYRLTDPATGRTQCYVRTNDPKYPSFIGKFVGVKGELVNDSTLTIKIVDMSETAIVDPARVNKGVSARIMPPSMLRSETANAGEN